MFHDTAFLFRAAALFSVICYPLRGTNVFKIQNTNTCKKYLNTNTKYIKINAFKYIYKIQSFVLQTRILYFKYNLFCICILNTKYIPSLLIDDATLLNGR